MLKTVAVSCALLVSAPAAATSGPPRDHLPPAPAGRPASTAGTYSLPVLRPAAVLRPFAPPLGRYGPGHLGVDLALVQGGVVVAAGSGVVRFAGPVAGRGVVVVQHPDGVSTEYEPLQPTVVRGAAVQRGQPIGRLSGRHRGCRSSCLHWGARRDGGYFDPLLLLRPLAPVRLLPWSRDG